MLTRKVAAIWRTSCCCLVWALSSGHNTCAAFQIVIGRHKQYHLIHPFWTTTMPKTKAKASAKEENISSSSSLGIMMILSPAKTLDLKPLSADSIPVTEKDFTLPNCSLEQTKEVAQAMKKRSEAELAKLLGVSTSIAKTSKEYWKNFEQDYDKRPAGEVKPSIYSFSGAAYQGLQAMECSKDAILYLQDNLRIVDPLYGILKPLDKMQPYRLEMATKNVFDSSKNQPKLEQYWKPAVTQQLARELMGRSEKILLNLASDEYAAAVDPAELQKQAPGVKFVKIVFRDQGRVVAIHAKRARGLMVRFLAETKAQTLDDVKQFQEEGYRLVAKDSDEMTIVFDRPKQEKKMANGSSTKRAATKATSSGSKKRGRTAK